MTKEEEKKMLEEFWVAAAPIRQRRVDEESQRINQREKNRKQREEKVARGEPVYNSVAHRCRCCNAWMYLHEYCGPENRCPNPKAELCSDCVRDGCM